MTNFKKHYVVLLIESVLLTVGYDDEPMKIPASGPALETARALLPYCITPLDGGRFIVLNRHYKPLGLSNYKQWVEYDDPQYQSLMVPADSIDVSTLSLNENGSYYFFGDGNSPIYRGVKRASDTSDYMFRLWLVFGKLGMSHPCLSSAGRKMVAKRLGVTVDSLEGPILFVGHPNA